MKTKAAVAFEAGKPLEIVELDIEGPKEGEVLVEIKASGICHTDAYTLSGADPEGIFPSILGHEGAGVVVEKGPNVKSLDVGDHVIPLYTPECRECEYCLNPKTNLCQSIRTTQGQGLMPDGTSRFSYNGKKIYHYMGTSTFSQFTVMPEIAAAKISEKAPFEKICYVGCGVTTGIGAVINTAKASSLDVTIQKQIIELLLKLQNEMSLSYLFISHDLNLVSKISHRILVMKDGKVVEQGNTMDIMNKPKNVYTKTLINSTLNKMV